MFAFTELVVLASVYGVGVLSEKLECVGAILVGSYIVFRMIEVVGAFIRM